MRSGDFATARRGGISREQLLDIWQERQKDRPTPWQVIAKMYGYPEPYIRGLMLSDDEALDMLSKGESKQAPGVQTPDVAPERPKMDAAARQERLEAFKRMWFSDVPSRDICEALGVDLEWIRKTRVRHGMPDREKGVPARPRRAFNIVRSRK